MLQLNVIPLSLMFTLASCLQDQGWKLNVSKSITVEKGSNVTIHCLFSYPEKHHTPDVKVYWKTAGTSVCAKTDNDKAAFVFHPNQTCVLPEFTGRTRLIGNENSGNCSLQILNITKEQSMYVRIIAKGDQYSFKKERVIISLKGTYVLQPTHEPDIITTALSTQSVAEALTLNTYIAAIIPAALAFVMIITGAAIFMKRKRSSRSVTREESSYYVNFRRALSNSHKRETVCKTSDIKVSEGKDVEDPIYINVQTPADEVVQSSDHKDNIYGNVDHLD
ncbi:Sialic acid-binding Ig-like lectin 5 [Oryzias melastigma]|uniref:Sialic acid-binding Ig-like lectin 5 n=1 Tax=Oryzias melastigma TaxID=30732 RepID=A0A834L1E0_ORYME|nr:uncharacterized protein LOC112143147 [Oryzias melastigma]XP_024122680.1 uncharacterized protein LOC112143147 [Oryzias melastigma]XP_036071823.1 uncharacterized protein LOC112143147 [Oryzias melastigma]KAF6739552.1 Sialic acid-binding Ig-like lectin 5 [Oryzias melastigma]